MRKLPRSQFVGLGLLFAVMYFIQGLGEPTEGLVKQPVVSLQKRAGWSAEQIGVFAAALAIPWAVKPLYGVLIDCVPLFGYRRKSYLILASAATLAGMLAAGLYEPAGGGFGGLLAILLVATVGIAFADVAIDSLMVEKGQPIGATGTLQSIQWTAISAATILVGWLGGVLSQRQQQQTAFWICAAVALVMLVASIFLVREPRYARPRHTLREAAALLGRAARTRTVWCVGGFLFLWNFNPFAFEVRNYHLTKVLGFSEEFYGETVALGAVGDVVAAVAYGFYCRRVKLAWLIHGSIALGIAGTAAYWLIDDAASALAVSFAFGLAYTTAILIQLDWAARVCRPESAGTVFALLLGLSNLGMSASAAVGGVLYDALTESLGSPTAAFQTLVLIGAATTAGCWLLAPFFGETPTARP